jgi:hypothetical protein
MAHFDLSSYETVEERLNKFWELHPNGRVATEIIHYDEKRVLIKASLYRNVDEPNPTSTGFAEEVFGSSPVNKTSFVENCETSAIGRATANMNLSVKGKRPSREEMNKVQRRSEEKPVLVKKEIAQSVQQGEAGLTTAQQVWVEKQLQQKYPSEDTASILSHLIGRQITHISEIEVDETRILIQKLAGK